jgi:hypothetical protein
MNPSHVDSVLFAGFEIAPKLCAVHAARSLIVIVSLHTWEWLGTAFSNPCNPRPFLLDSG